MARIFVSYRRSDSAYVTAALCEKLQQRFGRDSVFYDIDAVPLGVDFRAYITRAVEQCNVLLAMIGDAWNDADEAGRRRLDDPANYVRIEIEAALRRSIPVVPVLVGEAQMPDPVLLPESLREIVFRNATEIRAGRDFQQHLRQIIDGLDALFGDAAPPGEPAPPASEATQKGPPPLPGQRRPPPRSGPPPIPRAAPTPEDDAVVGRIRQYLSGFPVDAKLHVWGQIPADKLANARMAYAPQTRPQEVLLLYDDTVFGSGKNGFLLTRDALFWHNFSEQPRCVRLADIRHVSVKSGFVNGGVLVNGDLVAVTAGGPPAALLAALIAHVAPHAAM